MNPILHQYMTSFLSYLILPLLLEELHNRSGRVDSLSPLVMFCYCMQVEKFLAVEVEPALKRYKDKLSHSAKVEI